ncbi:LysR family transcriptional regulator [Bosea sp. PAMC 26642]|uniref:LysR family transcriptional regulator n=1 Tax=Bosea sp. (strain PAMC 26642) TaxID=1792307 RepID=UPI0007700F5C|nr:LysR family transcriptional regulator [Bosea sp. PAMC 26642]AMJ61004.1 hypothetical protein AXW83_12485 [Bosea sp. PAMC 26642]
MDLFSGITVFVQVADSGSYGAAARVLGLSPSAVGKAVLRLEERLGVRLFHRDNRNISVTAEGLRFLERCRTAVSEVAEAEADLSRSTQAPQGKLRVSLPLVSEQWNRVLLDFIQAFPLVSLELSYTNRVVDLVEEGFDVVLRIGELQDSRLRARRLGTFRLVLAASPDYLLRRDTPDTLDALESHACLRSRNASTCRLYDWPLGPDAAERSARLTDTLVVDHNAMLIAAALHGHGIACVPGFWAHEHLISGTLRQILAEETRNERGVSAVWPSGRGPSQKLSAFLDFMAERLPAALRASGPA